MTTWLSLLGDISVDAVAVRYQCVVRVHRREDDTGAVEQKTKQHQLWERLGRFDREAVET
jgi:hypothetical protein